MKIFFINFGTNFPQAELELQLMSNISGWKQIVLTLTPLDEYVETTNEKI